MHVFHSIATALGSAALILIPILVVVQYFVFRLLEVPFRSAGRVNRRKSLDEDRSGILAWIFPPREYEDRQVGGLDMEFADTVDSELGEFRNWGNPMRMLSLWARKIIWSVFVLLCGIEFLIMLAVFEFLK